MWKKIKKFFWMQCYYCKSKKEYFYYLWDTPKYDDSKKYTNDKELEICTDCAFKK